MKVLQTIDIKDGQSFTFNFTLDGMELKDTDGIKGVIKTKKLKGFGLMFDDNSLLKINWEPREDGSINVTMTKYP